MLADFGLSNGSAVWLALALLLGGGSLLAWPIVSRRLAVRRDSMMTRRVPTLDERVQAVASAKSQRDALERLIIEARETIRLGVAQMDERLARLEQLAPHESARPAMPAASIHVRTVEPARTPGESEDPLAKEVFALSDAGHSAHDIASRLNEHTGKVELMLALRRVG